MSGHALEIFLELNPNTSKVNKCPGFLHIRLQGRGRVGENSVYFLATGSAQEGW